MALASRDQTFAYESCRDLVEKLDREKLIDIARSPVTTKTLTVKPS